MRYFLGDTQSPPKTYKCNVPDGEVSQPAGLSTGEDLKKKVGEKPLYINRQLLSIPLDGT